MNLKNFIDGIAILRPYYDKPDGYHLGAEHDEVYLYKTDRPLSKEDVKKMRDLGWSQTDTEAEDEDGEDGYDPEDGWHAMV